MKEIFDYCKRNKMMIVLGLIIFGLGTGYFLTHKSVSQAPVKNDIKVESKATEKAGKSSKTAKVSVIVVDIQGAVKTPGVYRLKSGAIVQDALKMAGGLIQTADTKQLNQAKKLTDQMQIYVPVVGEKGNTGSVSSSNNGDKKVVNINTATVDDFKGVSGIGPKKAEKIIAFREKNGQFQQLHDLTKVSGIGEKSLDSLKDQLTV